MFALPWCCGCGDAGPPTYPVSGVVSYQGKPLPAGVILFRPKQGPATSAEIGPDGRYALTAVEGSHAVQVVSLDLPPGSENNDELLAGARSYIPTKYNRFQTSGLQATVEAKDENNIDFPLQ